MVISEMDISEFPYLLMMSFSDMSISVSEIFYYYFQYPWPYDIPPILPDNLIWIANISVCKKITEKLI
jgi:hypothetical protein